jgi:hypothetical protein
MVARVSIGEHARLACDRPASSPAVSPEELLHEAGERSQPTLANPRSHACARRDAGHHTRDGYAPQTSCRNRRSPRGGSFVADVANATLIAHDLLLALQLCLPYSVVAGRPGDAVRAPYGQERNREHWGSQTKTHNAGYSTWHSAKTQKPNSLGRRVLNATKAVFARDRLHRWRVVSAGAGHRTRDNVLPERRNREPEMFPRSTLRAV